MNEVQKRFKRTLPELDPETDMSVTDSDYRKSQRKSETLEGLLSKHPLAGSATLGERLILLGHKQVFWPNNLDLQSVDAAVAESVSLKGHASQEYPSTCGKCTTKLLCNCTLTPPSGFPTHRHTHGHIYTHITWAPDSARAFLWDRRYASARALASFKQLRVSAVLYWFDGEHATCRC